MRNHCALCASRSIRSLTIKLFPTWQGDLFNLGSNAKPPAHFLFVMWCVWIKKINALNVVLKSKDFVEYADNGIVQTVVIVGGTVNVNV